MNRALILAAVFIAWSVGVFVAGWQVRDGSADTAVATAATQQQAARADQAESARTTDHTNARAGAQVQQQRANAHAASASDFNTIERRVVEYVQANPDPASCDLDGDGLRAWREANAGIVFPGSEPGDPGGPAEHKAAGPTATRKR